VGRTAHLRPGLLLRAPEGSTWASCAGREPGPRCCRRIPVTSQPAHRPM